MDDELRRKLAASIDLPAPTEADPTVVRALRSDPTAGRYVRDIKTIDLAMRRWPATERSAAHWDAALATINARLDLVAQDPASQDPAAREPGVARVHRGPKASASGGVSRAERDASREDSLDADPAGPPRFEDDPAPPMETHQAMSETNENDVDLDSLAALTRTSTGPGAIPSVPQRAVAPSITDAIDDTSSGVVDIKHLARMARESAAAPAPAVVEGSTADAKPAATVALTASALADAQASSKPGAVPGVKKDDVMVMAARPAPAVVAPPPARRTSPLWGAVGAFAVSAAAFALYINTRGNLAVPQASEPTDNPSGAAPVQAVPTAAVAPAQPASPPAPVAAPAPMAPPPTETAGAVPQQPPGEPMAGPAPAPAALPTAATVVPNAPAQESAVAGDPSLRRRAGGPAADVASRDTPADHVGAHHAHAAPEVAPHGAPGTTVSAAERTTGPAPARLGTGGAAPDTATTRASASAAPAPAPPPAAHAVAPAAPAGGAGRSIDDLLNSAAPSHAAAPAPAAAAAPSAELPERLSRPQVSAVMSPLNAGARTCAQGQSGTAPVSITIGGDGAVRSATVSGQFAGTPAGDCIAGLVQRAHFPQFRAASSTFVWPFVILPPR